jgi:hypothetical protein
VIETYQRFSRKNRKLSVLFVLAHCVLGGMAIAQPTAISKAVVQPPPSYSPEEVGGNQLQLQGAFSEARSNDGGLIEVWRGANNNQVWISIDNGEPFTIGSTQTYTNPTVTPWGPQGYMIFHVGINGLIYFHTVYSDGWWNGDWDAIPGQSTNTSMAVSAVQMGNGSHNVYLVYRGSGNDYRVWGTWYDGNDGVWAGADNIATGVSFFPPSITFNPESQRLFAVVQGAANNHVYLTTNQLGSAYWPPWTDLGPYTVTNGQPFIAADGDGDMTISLLGPSGHSQWAQFNSDGNQLTSWEADPLTSPNAISLSSAAHAIFLLYNIYNEGWWRVIYPGAS